MRRDILELDTAVGAAIRRHEVTLEDVEAMRLVLGGLSIVDWQRAIFPDLASVDRYLSLLLIDPDDPTDKQRLRYVFNEAVSYLEEQLHLKFPQSLRDPKRVRDVFVWASETAGFRRRQVLSCVILKLMHVIHHMEAADLKFKSAISEAELCDLAEARILRMGRDMRDSGLPVVSFYGSRKSRSSIITKLIAKKETLAATIFDKLRFRIVVERYEDLVPTLAWMRHNVFPFNYTIPNQTHNNLIDPASLVDFLDAVAQPQVSGPVDEVVQDQTSKNEFSGRNYRMLNFIVDYPVPLPHQVVGAASFELGRVVFMMVEFQLLDEETARRNEEGENAHHLYKQRQGRVVAERLKRGALDPKSKRRNNP